jgi:hypothetical protein
MVGRIEGVGLLFGMDGGMGRREGGREVTESLDCWVGWMGLVGVGGGGDWFNQTEDSEWRIGVVEGLVEKGWIGLYFLGGPECVGPFCIFRDVWMRTHRAAVSKQARYQLSHQSTYMPPISWGLVGVVGRTSWMGLLGEMGGMGGGKGMSWVGGSDRWDSLDWAGGWVGWEGYGLG